MPGNPLPRCSSHSSSPYPSRPSSRLCSRPSSPSAVQNQSSQSCLCTLPPPYPTVPAENIVTPPHIQFNGKPQLELPGISVPSISSSTLHDNPQIVSLPPCPPFSFESPLSPSRRNVLPALDVWFGNIPITNVVAQVSANTHQNPSVYPLFENSQHPLPNVDCHPAGHQPSHPLNTSPSLDATRLHANLILPQSSFVHPPPPGPVNHDCSRSVEHLPSYHVYHTASQRPPT